MPMTSLQLITNALQIAKAPGFTTQALQTLNLILSDLCETYDFDLAKTTFTFNFNTSVNYGPNFLPTDYLRSSKDDVYYVISGVPYVMINLSNAEYDSLVQQPGLNAYPENYTIVFDSTGVNPPSMYVWPPPSGAFPVTVRYYRQMPDISNTATIPWFPNQNYLQTRLAGEMMRFTDDERVDKFLGNAEMYLSKYLKMKDSEEDRVKLVTLDRRKFGSNFNRLPNTKTVGW